MDVIFLFLTMAIIIIMFVFLKRPMYEAMIVAYLAVVIFSGNISHLWEYTAGALSNSLLYVTLGFLVFSTLLNKTGIVEDFISIILALIGRISGGAGYVAIAASSLIGSLSGNSPGNAAAVGPIMIPVMKKTGFSSELAATVVCAASALGPIIPPSGTIVVIYGLLMQVYPDCVPFSQFWMMMWGISIWFILQRVMVLAVRVKMLGIKAVPKDQLPDLKEALKKGWKALFIPVLIFGLFLFDNRYNSTFIASRLGSEGATIFSASLLAIVPAVASLFALIISRKKIRVPDIPKLFYEEIPQIAPCVIMTAAGFALGNAFNGTGLNAAIAGLVEGKQVSKIATILVIPLIYTFMGMFFEGLSINYMIGTTCIILGHAVGINPILMGGMLGVMSHAQGQMTPPFALTFYIPMVMAKADFRKMVKEVVLWCTTQYFFIVLVLAGILPILGLIPFHG